MWESYISPSKIELTLHFLDRFQESGLIVAGATDLLLELERGAHPQLKTIIDISRIEGLDFIYLDSEGFIHIGPLVTHNQCLASDLIQQKAFPLARACWEVGAPQIRNRGTIAGNLITASPANDTITPLMALNANLVLRSISGERTIRLEDFYLGVRKTILQPGEILVDIYFKGLTDNQLGTFVKLALRRTQAISVINLAVLLTMEKSTMVSASITLGSVAPTIIHATEAETYLVGRQLDQETINAAAILAAHAAMPIDDLRASATYRREMVRILAMRSLRSLQDGSEKTGFPGNPVCLADNSSWQNSSIKQKTTSFDGTEIRTRINGKESVFLTGFNKSLLRLLREEAGLIGTKEGCAEGECGACTIFMDGKAVLACLIPAPRAHGSEIVTIEGLAGYGGKSTLHPVQESFIKHGAVQCGYCSPGFIMSAAKLLEERSHPSKNEIQQALAGNLCRCTGYYKIIQAVEDIGNI